MIALPYLAKGQTRVIEWDPKSYLCMLGLLRGTVEFRRPAAFRPSVALIKEVVAAHYKVRLLDMESERRSRDVARPRQIAMYLARKLTTKSMPSIGRIFGKRDHTTVMYACRQVSRLIEDDAEIAADVAALEATIMHALGAV